MSLSLFDSRHSLVKRNKYWTQFYEMDPINQKEYLKKYLGIGKAPGEKKKKKKPTAKRVQIIDDDADANLPNNIMVEDPLQTNEYAPQIVAIIDERPPSLRVDEKTKNPLWQPIGSAENIDKTTSKPLITGFKIGPKPTNESILTLLASKSPPGTKRHAHTFPRNKEEKSSEFILNDDSLSPSRSRHEDDVFPHGKSKQRNDNSPCQKSRQKDDDFSPPRKARTRDDDFSPPRKGRTRDDDFSPPRKSKTRVDDFSPPRKSMTRNKDISPPRRNRPRNDISPPRKSRTNNKLSPIRKSKHKFVASSPPRSKKESIKRSRTPDNSSPRNHETHDEVKSPYDESKSKKMEKTLDGKSAGLQNSLELVQETQKVRSREDRLFKTLSKDVSGENAETVHRDRKTGRIRNLEEEEEQKRKKQEEEEKNKEKYSRWGRGLVQVENRNQQIQEELHEMSKPLARYADDEDLERYLKEQEREGDPMLAYIRKKKKKQAADAGEVVKPLFEGQFMPNRFGIRPGHRWDGVDRSNGYEKKWFEVQNAKKAQQEDTYKWSTEDM